ncbi:holo-ACP synthase [Buchnera aphidicola (Aphis craccivora)]|uniref:L-aminoadipate-semialdehyde dehydrogenase-phosphopantetheinyl transferase n=2 Tax=cellular organisms TaxID=131567 RepID=A0A6G0VSG6_APHCR|nr:holo-ACP synthase [Buchnera aphidicola]KAF0707666.1 Holo-[acyl-carrier-protein] synthase [Aphis craccivora]QCI16505.1 holo-ACP synthase [Buchnera aphidicola (Aphis craccivora)]QLL40642.1 holo-ACP synthase [Buchnera aphidicola (Aphis craccivore)]WAI18016.1 MAG: holo-ACP synthase [Buchnera aphidicola (Aphis craccivora)]
MTIIGIGTDIIEISRIKRIFFKFGNKLAKKILSIQEWKEYIISKNKIHFIAKKFAAKEAASKALGTGINYGITFKQLELYNNSLGKPYLRFLDHAFKKCKEIECKFIHVSITDQKLYAHAIVILES